MSEEASSFTSEVERRAQEAPGAIVIPSSATDVPSNFDLSAFTGTHQQQDLQDFLNVASDYVRAHIYINQFSTDDEREQWESKQASQLRQQYGVEAETAFNNYINHDNRIPRNSMYHFIEHQSMFGYSGVLEHPDFPLDQFNRIIELYNSEVAPRDQEDPNLGQFDPWSVATPDHKIEVVNEIADNALEILRHFEAKQS